jgi:quercetin dioxygenase-like cupin family protein
MDYVRQVDGAALAAAGSNERFSQWLLDHTTGAQHCSVNFVRTPAGGGSPAGLHTHAGDQIFYILEGTMSVEIEGQQYEAGAGSLVVFPAGVPHRNWNSGAEPTVHVAINAPLPDPTEVFARPA